MRNSTQVISLSTCRACVNRTQDIECSVGVLKFHFLIQMLKFARDGMTSLVWLIENKINSYFLKNQIRIMLKIGVSGFAHQGS